MVRNRARQRFLLRRHYDEHKAAYFAKAKKHDVAQRRRITAYILDYLSAHPCVDCGESDPIVLEFDHRDPVAKDFDISNMRFKAFSLGRVMEEIAKCDVRCANCHRRRTYRQRIDGELSPKSLPIDQLDLFSPE